MLSPLMYRLVGPRMCRAVSLLFLAAASGLAGCASTEKAPAAPSTLEIGPDSNGKVFAVRGIRTVVVRLPGNPTTGYSWVVASIRGDAVKAFGDIGYRADMTDRPLVGSGGAFEIAFRIVAKGESVVTLEYRRPWEKDTAAAKTFTITLNVETLPSSRGAAG